MEIVYDHTQEGTGEARSRGEEIESLESMVEKTEDVKAEIEDDTVQSGLDTLENEETELEESYRTLHARGLRGAGRQGRQINAICRIAM